MDLELDLGSYNNIDFSRVSDWVVEHIITRSGDVVVGMQFNEYDVKYGPRIQFVIEERVRNKLKHMTKENEFRKMNVRFIIISDNQTPLCCIDVLNTKKSHSDLLLRFGECCYKNIAEFKVPLLIIRPDSHFNNFNEEGTYTNLFVECLYEFFCIEIDKILKKTYNNNDSEERKYSNISIIFSFHYSFLNSDIKNNLSNLTDKLNDSDSDLKNNKSIGEINGYFVSDIESNEHLIDKSTVFICDRVIEKLSQNSPELDLVKFENQINENNHSDIVIFIQFSPKGAFENFVMNENLAYSNCFVRRVFLRYNQIFNKTLITELTFTNNSWNLTLDNAYYDNLNKLVAKRFISIEKALSIQKINRVALMIFPGITADDWKLINFYLGLRSRKDTNGQSDIPIETHIILFTSITEVKLRNFPNIDIYCYFGCQEYFFYHILYRLGIKSPVILTPYEYEIYLGIREWTPTFLTVSELINFRNTEQELSNSSSNSHNDFRNNESIFIKHGNSEQNVDSNTQIVKKYSFEQIKNYESESKKVISILRMIKSNFSNSFYGLNPIENTETIPKITHGRDGVASIYKNEA